MSLTIKVLGPGCRNCVILDRVTRAAVADLGLDATVAAVEDYQAIIDYGVMSTPPWSSTNGSSSPAGCPARICCVNSWPTLRTATQTQTTIEGNHP